MSWKENECNFKLKFDCNIEKFHCTLSFIMESWHNLSPRAAETSSIPMSLALYRTPSPLNLLIRVASLRSWPAETARTRGWLQQANQARNTSKGQIRPKSKHLGGIRRKRLSTPKGCAVEVAPRKICSAQMRFTEGRDKPESRLVKLKTCALYELF